VKLIEGFLPFAVESSHHHDRKDTNSFTVAAGHPHDDVDFRFQFDVGPRHVIY